MDKAITTHPYTKPEIIAFMSSTFKKVDTLFESLDKGHFAKTVDNKWSPGEQLQHLILSTNPLTLGLKLPKAALLIFGTHQGKSNGYEDVVANYKAALDKGGKATSPYIPKKLKSSQSDMISKWKKAYSNLIIAIDKWSESELDKYQFKHPLLGKMTVREMLFFTIYHTQHHTDSIKELLKKFSE